MPAGLLWSRHALQRCRQRLLSRVTVEGIVTGKFGGVHRSTAADKTVHAWRGICVVTSRGVIITAYVRGNNGCRFLSGGVCSA